MACPHSAVETCELCAATLDSEGGKTLLRGEAPPLEDGQLAPGASIGRYVVLARLGQGGMGVVYTARDPQLERVVAVKVLRSRGGTASEAAQARLLREAQAMAQLAHPNVVPVYDSGPWGQGVFIVMELVRGATLDTWVKVAPRAWRDVVALFVEAGRGLEAAHASGLIHRDFKPTNVLVGEDGRPRVTDFGLARVSGERSATSLPPEGSGPFSLETPLTLAGTMMGSPGYMAPEQYAGAETTAATDQFAFCVSLYEALYGARPFVAKTIPELELVTSRGVVPPAPKGSPVPAWVHRILVRGLSPEAAKRHPSMTGLLRALTDDPALKRRRWYAVGAAAAVLVTAMAGTWWTGAQRQAQACRGAAAMLDGVWDGAVRARAQQAFLATKLPFAAATWALTRDALDVWAGEWVAARTEACEATRVRGENTERQLLLRFECLDRRHEELAALAEAFASADVELVTNGPTAAARLSPIVSCANLKQLEDRRAPPPALADQARELAQQVAQARALVAAVRYLDARPRLEAIAARAGELKLAAVEGEALEALGDLEHAARDFARARTAWEGAVRAAEAAGDDVQAARVLSRLVSLVGWRLERPAEARTWAALASGIVERIGGDRLILARIEEGLGDTEWQDGRRVQALAAYRRSLALYVAEQGAESLDVARLYSSTGWVLTEQGELEAARETLERSRVMRVRLLGPGHPSLGESLNELAMLALEQRDLEASVRYARQNLAVIAPLGLTRRTLSAQASLMATLAATEPAEALALFDEVRTVLEGAELSSPVREFQQSHVEALIAVGREKEALTEGRVWLAERERALGKVQPDVLTLAASVSRAAAALGLWGEALEGAERYLAGKASLGGVDSPRTGLVLLRSAQAHLALGKAPEALPRAERAVVALARGPLSRPQRGEARRTLAEALLRNRQEPDRAALLLQQAKEDAHAAGDDALLARIAKLTK